ncbi:MAG: TetR family transcriptional regulator [Alphaproteobacteria bacterium]|nr:TetR family transcriptional regulator [Alphaproteobacteria bacterium]
MARKCKEDAEKTRLAVLESALDVFSDKGYAKATFDEIAARAGFTKGAVYWYFRNKADLVAALILEYVGAKRQEVMKLLPEGNTFDDLLDYFIIWADAGAKDLRFSRFQRFVMCQMEWSEAVLSRVEKTLATTKDWHLEKVNQVLTESSKRGELKEGINIDVVQHVIISTYMGIVFSSISKRVPYDLVEMVRTGLTLLFEGLKK